MAIWSGIVGSYYVTTRFDPEFDWTDRAGPFADLWVAERFKRGMVLWRRWTRTNGGRSGDVEVRFFASDGREFLIGAESF